MSWVLARSPGGARYRKAGMVGLVLVAFAGLLVWNSSRVLATPRNSVETGIENWTNELEQEELTPSREQAQAALEQAGDAAVSPLLTALRSPNAILRRNAAEVLGYIGSGRSIAMLTSVLANDADARVRVEAAWALSQMDDLTTAATLERASLLDPDARVRQAANDALEGIRWNLATRAGYNVVTARVFAVAPSQPATVYLAADDQVLVSEDSGKTWRHVSKTPGRVVSLAVSSSDANTVYLGTESAGLYASRDGGQTWTR